MKRLLYIGLAGLLIVAVLLAVVLFTGPGFRLLLKLAPLGGVEISYTGSSGSLADFSFDQLQVDVAGTTINADQLALDWSPTALLKRNVQIANFQASGLRVALPVTQQAAEPTAPLDFTRGVELPVTVALAQLAITDLKVLRADELVTEIGRVQIEQVNLGTAVWQADSIAVDAPQWQIRMDGKLAPQPGFEHAIRATVTANDNVVAINLAGNSGQSVLSLNLNDNEVGGRLTLNQWTTTPNWDLTIDADDFQTVTSANLEGHGTLAGAEGTFDAAVGETRIELRQWRVTRQGLRWRIHLDAAMDPLNALLDFELDTERLHLAQIDVSSTDPLFPTASVSASGPFADLAMDAQILLPAGQPPGPGSIEFQGQLKNFSQLVIEQLDGAMLDGRLDGSGVVDFAPSLAANLLLSVQGLDLSALDERLPSGLSGDVTVTSTRPAEVVQTRLDLDVAARLGATPVTIKGAASLADAQPRSGDMLLQAGPDNRVELKLVDPRTVTLKASVRALEVLLAGATGQIETDLEVQLGSRWPLASGSASITSLTLPTGQSVANAQIELRHDGLDLVASEISAGAQVLEAVSLNLVGGPETHQYQLSASHAAARLDLAGSGKSQGDRYSFAIDTLKAVLPRDQIVSNEQPIEGEVGADLLRIDPTCLVSPDLRLCGSARRDSQATQVSLTLNSPAVEKLPWRDLQTDLINVLIPQGQLDTRLELTLAPGEMLIDGQLRLAGLRIEEAGGEGLTIADLAADIKGTAQQSKLNLSAQLPRGALNVEGTLTDMLDEAKIQARARANLEDLAVLSVLVPDIQLERGSANADFALRGAMAQPAVSGTLELARISADLPQLGITPELQLTVELPEGREGTFTGSMRSGTGEASLSGMASWDGEFNLSGKLTGKELLLSNTETVSLAASPALNIQIKGSQTSIDGRIAVNRGHVALAPSAASGPRASADVIIVDTEQDKKPDTPSQVALNIRIDLEQAIEITGFGLTGALAGRLTVRQAPGEPMLANGELNLTGQYAAFGQKLSITEGRLIYVNTPLDDPVIELYAGREVDGAKVGVRVTGRVSSLNAVLESSPAMNESEQLSLLVLGRRPGALDEAQSDQLATAAMSLALSQGNKALGGLGGGLPELSLTQELGGLAVAIGKQLSPRLYVGYTVDLLKPVQLVRLRYRMTDSWTAETELGLESRGAIRYRRER